MKKFYKTTFNVVVLSEEPIPWMPLSELHHVITDGDCCGNLIRVAEEELDGKQTVAALIEQGSGPEFFRLDDDGEEIES